MLQAASAERSVGEGTMPHGEMLSILTLTEYFRERVASTSGFVGLTKNRGREIGAWWEIELQAEEEKPAEMI